MSKLIEFLRGLFRKKKEEKIIPVEETKEPQTEIKETVASKEKSHQNFSELIQNIDSKREEIIHEKEENKLKVISDENSEDVKISFKKKIFVVDKEDYTAFEEEFNRPGFALSVHTSGKNSYLTRINNDTEKEDFFDRFLMHSEIAEFCLKNYCEKEDVAVQHINDDTKDNRRKNLQVVIKEEKISNPEITN